LNNNNRNNRRRGRGNRPQGGNGSQLNRIDSRARGNAPQMLDKYKKLAQDAHHNGDRVQMEYYLQFADHYFRVIADNKARQDEVRGGRRPDEREAAEEYGDDDFDFDRGRRNDRPSHDRQNDDSRQPRGDAEEGESGQESETFTPDDRDDGRSESQPRQQNARRQPRKPRDDGRGERPERNDRPERAARADRPERSEPRIEKPAEKRAEKPAPRARKPRPPVDTGHGSIDSSILPPSIRSEDSGNGSGDGDGTLEAVG